MRGNTLTQETVGIMVMSKDALISMMYVKQIDVLFQWYFKIFKNANELM